MREVLDPPHILDGEQTGDLRLLIPRESWFACFFNNLRTQFSRDDIPSIPKGSDAIAFWSDVFVDRSLPWKRFLQSAAYHALLLAIIWSGSRFLALQPRVTAPSTFTRADVVYYTPSEYLPSLDTRRPDSALAHKADPEYSAQPIISVPPEADNHSQTIVTPPSVRLHNNVALPNVVALLEKMPGDSRMPIGPAPAVPVSEVSRITPRMDRSVIAPPPEVNNEVNNNDSHKTFSARQAAVIAPPPNIEPTVIRRQGDLNIAHSSVIAPAPQLALDQQSALPGRTSNTLNQESAQVIAPPPSLGAPKRSHSAGSIIALSLHPSVGRRPTYWQATAVAALPPRLKAIAERPVPLHPPTILSPVRPKAAAPATRLRVISLLDFMSAKLQPAFRQLLVIVLRKTPTHIPSIRISSPTRALRA
jgi:hypothetical protein